MDRRSLLKSAVSAASLLAVPDSYARLACQDYGPGVRQCRAGIDSALMGITANQARSQWCWAACIAMVFKYYGHPVSQIRIVEEAWGDIYNLPAQPHHVLASLNRPWTDDHGEDFTVISGSGSTGPVQVAQDLSNDMPLIIGTHGHAVVLTALTYSSRPYGGVGIDAATVRDPWPGRGRRFLSAQEWAGIMFAAQIRVE